MSRVKGRRPGAPARWTPLTKGTLNPVLVAALKETGNSEIPSAAWSNDVYQVLVRDLEGGWTHLSIKRHDRRAVRDWRHLQSIKNEVCGLERWGMEMFPPESRLVDTSNEYHLFVAPAGLEPPVSYGQGRAVIDADVSTEGRVAGENLARQRPWQEGLLTGPELGGVVPRHLARSGMRTFMEARDRARKEQ